MKVGEIIYGSYYSLSETSWGTVWPLIGSGTNFIKTNIIVAYKKW